MLELILSATRTFRRSLRFESMFLVDPIRIHFALRGMLELLVYTFIPDSLVLGVGWSLLFYFLLYVRVACKSAGEGSFGSGSH